MASTEADSGAATIKQFSRLRRGSTDKNASTVSLGTSSASDGVDSPVKTAVDSTLDKIRSRTRRTSVDDRRGSGDSGSKLSKLLPGKRHRVRKTPSTDNLERPLSGQSGLSNGLPGNQSDSSIGVNGSGHSSLLTEDASDQEV